MRGIVGAAGKMYWREERDGWMEGSWCSSELHPAGESPSPWRKIRAAGLFVLEEVDVDAEVDMALICVSLVVAAVMNKRGNIDSFALRNDLEDNEGEDESVLEQDLQVLNNIVVVS